jgi:hypothetical protein
MREIFGLYPVRAVTTYCMGFKASQPSLSSKYCVFIGRPSFSTVSGPESKGTTIRTTDSSPAYRFVDGSEEKIDLLLALIQKKTDSSEAEAKEMLELKGDILLKHSIFDIADIVETFEEQLSMTPKQLKVVFQLRKSLWRQSPGFLANAIQLLKEEYHLSKEIVKSITNVSKSATNILNPAILRDCAERKLIFESIYGKDCFDRVQQLRTSVAHAPSLLYIPLSLFYDRINNFLTLFGYNHPRELEWMLPTSFVYNDLDYLERKTKLLYRYLTRGLELTTSEGNPERKRFVIPKEEYEKHQVELEKKYRFLLHRPPEEIVDYGKIEEKSTKRTTKMRITNLKSGDNVRKQIVEDEFLYESYRRYLSEDEGVEKAGLYEDLVMNTIRDYSERNRLDVLKDIDPLFMKGIEEKLFKEAQLPLEALYQELWKLSEQRDDENHFSHERALQCIQHMEMTNVSFSYLLSKLGMLAIYSNQLTGQFLLGNSGFLRYSLEENIFPKLIVLGIALRNYFQGKQMMMTNEKENPQQSSQQSPRSRDEILQECVHAYRAHPVRVELTRCFYFISNFSLNDIERGMELFEQFSTEEKEFNLLHLRKFIVLAKAIRTKEKQQGV